METQEILNKLQNKIEEMYNEATKSLENLNKQVDSKYDNVTSMYQLDGAYYRNIARYAWSYRAKQTAMVELHFFLKKLIKEQNGE